MPNTAINGANKGATNKGATNNGANKPKRNESVNTEKKGNEGKTGNNTQRTMGNSVQNTFMHGIAVWAALIPQMLLGLIMFFTGFKLKRLSDEADVKDGIWDHVAIYVAFLLMLIGSVLMLGQGIYLLLLEFA